MFSPDGTLISASAAPARHNERGKKTRRTKKEVGKNRPGVRPQRAVENREKWKKTGCKIICGAPTTLAVKELMMMMMMMIMNGSFSVQ